jgi:hypothetical protein
MPVPKPPNKHPRAKPKIKPVEVPEPTGRIARKERVLVHDDLPWTIREVREHKRELKVLDYGIEQELVITLVMTRHIRRKEDG